MLKKIVKKIIEYCYILITPKLIKRINKIKNIIYSNYVKHGFNEVKEPFFVEFPTVFVGSKYVSIGKNFSSHKNLRIEAWDNYMGESYLPKIQIGDNVSFNYNCHIGAINHIKIGNNVLIGSNVFITDHSHGTSSLTDLVKEPKYRLLFSKGPVFIEKNAWIGENVTILPNTIIGESSIIGANSVVTKNVPAFSIAVGNPITIIRKKNND